MTNFTAIKGGRHGFTLVELLVAMAVLVLICVLIAGIMDATARTTRVSNRTVDAATQSRLAFDRIGMDLAALVRRTDTDFQAGNADTTLLFLSNISSPDILSKTGLPGGNRGVSVVAYKVAVHTDNQDAKGAARICLLRGTVPVGLNDTGYMGVVNGLPLRFTDASVALSYLPTDFDVLAPGVLRVVVGYQLFPDNQAVALADGSSVTGTGQVVYSAPVRTITSSAGGSAVNYIDLSHISAVVVGLVVVDTESLKLLSARDASDLAALFDVPTSPDTPSKAWSSQANTAASLGSSPLPVRQAVCVYQRFYPITPYGWN